MPATRRLWAVDRMNYNNIVTKMEELILELIQTGAAIPAQIITDMQTCRSLVSIAESNPADPEAAQKATLQLQMLEAQLVILADSVSGKEYADRWQADLSTAYTENAKKPSVKKTFVSGVPKGCDWIRIDIAEITMDDELRGLIQNLGLSSVPQEDGYLLLYGKKEDISHFLKEVRKRAGKKGS